jgi:hypothetical protein
MRFDQLRWRSAGRMDFRRMHDPATDDAASGFFRRREGLSLSGDEDVVSYVAEPELGSRSGHFVRLG